MDDKTYGLFFYRAKAFFTKRAFTVESEESPGRSVRPAKPEPAPSQPGSTVLFILLTVGLVVAAVACYFLWPR